MAKNNSKFSDRAFEIHHISNFTAKMSLLLLPFASFLCLADVCHGLQYEATHFQIGKVISGFGWTERSRSQVAQSSANIGIFAILDSSRQESTSLNRHTCTQ